MGAWRRAAWRNGGGPLWGSPRPSLVRDRSVHLYLSDRSRSFRVIMCEYDVNARAMHTKLHDSQADKCPVDKAGNAVETWRMQIDPKDVSRPQVRLRVELLWAAHDKRRMC